MMRVPLSPSAGWQRIAGGIASAATREDMMTALAGLEAVLVKATVDGVDRTSSFRLVHLPICSLVVDFYTVYIITISRTQA